MPLGGFFADEEDHFNAHYLSYFALLEIATSFTTSSKVATQITDFLLKELLSINKERLLHPLQSALIALKSLLPSDYIKDSLLSKLLGYVKSSSAPRYKEAIAAIAELATTPEAKDYISSELSLSNTQKNILFSFGLLVVGQVEDKDKLERGLTQIQAFLGALPSSLLSNLKYIILTTSGGRAEYYGFSLGLLSLDLSWDPINNGKTELVNAFTSWLFHEMGHSPLSDTFSRWLRKVGSPFFCFYR
jgi:hypothetical protein